MATVLITGGTGLIGKALSGLLIQKGYDIIVLTRKPKPSAQNISYAAWDLEKQTIDNDAIRNADYIIHLAGAGIADKRWTKKRKKELLASRTQSSALLVKSMKEIPNEVKAVISASAIGWYGKDPAIPNPNPFTEDYPHANDFLGHTCAAWEESIHGVKEIGMRLVILRTGIVLSNDGGALKEFKKPVRFGVAGILGSGRQVISWIHVDDLCRLYLTAIKNEEMKGVFNAVAPYPVSNKDLMVSLTKKIKGPLYIPIHVPRFVLKIMLGEMSVEVLKSTTVKSERIQGMGFQFLYPSIEAALKELVENN